MAGAGWPDGLGIPPSGRELVEAGWPVRAGRLGSASVPSGLLSGTVPVGGAGWSWPAKPAGSEAALAIAV